MKQLLREASLCGPARRQSLLLSEFCVNTTLPTWLPCQLLCRNIFWRYSVALVSQTIMAECSLYLMIDHICFVESVQLACIAVKQASSFDRNKFWSTPCARNFTILQFLPSPRTRPTSFAKFHSLPHTSWHLQGTHLVNLFNASRLSLSTPASPSGSRGLIEVNECSRWSM